MGLIQVGSDALTSELLRTRCEQGHFCGLSDLEHGGSWVRIPSGAQTFSVSSHCWFFTSPCIFLHEINYHFNISNFAKFDDGLVDSD